MTKISLKLFTSFQKGDTDAFVKIMQRLHPRVFGFAKKMVRIESDAEEIAQDVFVKLWQNRERIQSHNSLNSYIYMIARNQIYDFVRGNHPTIVDYESNSFAHKIVPDVASEYEAKELDLLITLKVEKMSPQRRKVFEMSVREGLSHDEISEKLKITKKTVSNHLYYVLNELGKSFL